MSKFQRADGSGRMAVQFTLIELLMVIAIIVILAAMLFPVLNRARAQAKYSNCISNLKQFGNYFFLYTGDNDDFLPWNTMCGSQAMNMGAKTGQLPFLLWEYTNGLNKMYLCPANRRGFYLDANDNRPFITSKTATNAIWYEVSYGYRGLMRKNFQNTSSAITKNNVKITMFKHPSRQVPLSDNYTWHHPTTLCQISSLVHRLTSAPQVNALFLDGRASRWTSLLTGRDVNSFLFVHGTPTAANALDPRIGYDEK